MPRGSGFGVVFLQVAVVIGLGALAGCSRPLPVPGGTSCTDIRDCVQGQICSVGTCVAEGVTGCITDLDCSVDGSQLCNAGICVTAGANTNNSSCTSTSECAIDTFCNTATGLCAPLLDNWCRVDDQCRSTSPVCSNKETGSATPGRCLQCLTATDCEAGATCNPAGVCISDGACPANATAIGDGTCRCNIGFVDNGAGGCAATSTGEGEGEGEGEGGGEGEGEGEGPITPVDFGGSCSNDFQCWDRSGNSDTFCDEGQCACDEFWLFLTCDLDYDTTSCTCVDQCGGLDYVGECVGDVVRWCEDGSLQEYDCAQLSDTCGFVNNTVGNDCVAR